MTTWYSEHGETEPPVRDPQPIRGTMTATGLPLSIEVDGKRLQVVERHPRWLVAEDTNPVSGDGWDCILSDGSRWCLIRDISSGKRWTGAPLP